MLSIQEATGLGMEEIVIALNCQNKICEISLYGSYPKYIFFGDAELEGITYFDARKLYRYLPGKFVSYDIRKVVKTCDTCYGKSYYHIETEEGKFKLIIDSTKSEGCTTIIEE